MDLLIINNYTVIIYRVMIDILFFNNLLGIIIIKTRLLILYLATDKKQRINFTIICLTIMFYL